MTGLDPVENHRRREGRIGRYCSAEWNAETAGREM